MSVIVLCFVVRHFMSILVLQSSWWRRESWLLCLICLPGVSWGLSSSSSRCHRVACGLWLWYFLIILTYYFRGNKKIQNDAEWPFKTNLIFVWDIYKAVCLQNRITVGILIGQILIGWVSYVILVHVTWILRRILKKKAYEIAYSSIVNNSMPLDCVSSFVIFTLTLIMMIHWYHP